MGTNSIYDENQVTELARKINSTNTRLDGSANYNFAFNRYLLLLYSPVFM